MRAADNPFAVHRVLAERYRLDEPGWTRLMTRLQALDNRGAIVGPHGSGKTTLLEDLGARLRIQGWRVTMLRFDSTERGLGPGTAYDAGEVVLVDGAEQLSWIDWQRLRFRARHAGGFVVTTHHAGLLPTMYRCETSPELLQGLTRSLGEPVSADESAVLHTRHEGNLRDALRELYDRWASAKPPSSCCITAVALQLEEEAKQRQET